jgi:hypothetical protein
VERVHVHSGGQAVVGMVETPGGGDRPKSEEQPHAITYAPGVEMPSAIRPVPDARRNVTGRAEG